VRAPAHPPLNQINTRVWLTELSRSLGRPATLDDVPDDALDRVASRSTALFTSYRKHHKCKPPPGRTTCSMCRLTSKATVNREFAFLRRMLKLGH
jgi:hypothetical protein